MKLRSRILLFTFGLLLFFGVTVAAFLKTEFSARLSGELQKRGVSIAKQIAGESASAILSEDSLNLTLIARSRMAVEEDILYVIFLDAGGKRIIGHSFGHSFPTDLIGANPLEPGRDHAIRALTTEHGTVHDIAVPVLGGGIGQVRVGISAAPIESAVKAIITEILSLTAVLLILGGVAAIPISRAVTEPVQHLTEAAEEIAAGHLDREVAIRSRDEVGELAASFNRMIHNLNGARTKLEGAARLRDEFISTAAHEFQTPLSVIIGFSELMMEAKDLPPEEKQEYLAIISEKAHFLSRIVDDLLDVSRVEAGQGLSLHPEDCRIEKIVGAAVETFRRRSSRHRFALHLSAAPAELHLDRERITQVMENLLSNAVKYSPQGGTIRVTGETQEGFYKIIVEDEGKGMSADQAARIFDKFYRADTSDTAPSGTGLGMFIVKSIIDVHGGTIEIFSTPGTGTRVEFTLPHTPPVGAQLAI